MNIERIKVFQFFPSCYSEATTSPRGLASTRSCLLSILSQLLPNPPLASFEIEVLSSFNSFPVATHTCCCGRTSYSARLSILSQLLLAGLRGADLRPPQELSILSQLLRGGGRTAWLVFNVSFQFFPSCYRALGSLPPYKPFLRELRSS